MWFEIEFSVSFLVVWLIREMSFKMGDCSKLFEILPIINNNNNQKEYYLTDVINILLENNEQISINKTKNINEIIGINTLNQLKEANNEC